MARLDREDCYDAIEKLKESIGIGGVLSSLEMFLDTDTLSEFIEDTAKDYDLEDDFPEIFGEEND